MPWGSWVRWSRPSWEWSRIIPHVRLPSHPTVTKIHAHSAAAATARNRTTLSVTNHHCLPCSPNYRLYYQLYYQPEGILSESLHTTIRYRRSVEFILFYFLFFPYFSPPEVTRWCIGLKYWWKNKVTTYVIFNRDKTLAFSLVIKTPERECTRNSLR